MPVRGWAIALVLAGCSGTGTAREGTSTGGGKQEAGSRTQEAAPEAGPDAAPESTPIVLVTEPAALAVVADGGGALDDLLARERQAVVAEAVKQDVAAARKKDPSAGVGVRGHSHRLFDVRWLATGHFELIGVAYRVDRIPFTPGRCGEIRLIYRLAYSAVMGGETVSSRLPMTVSVVLAGEPEDRGSCAHAARAWMAPAVVGELGGWLLAGPLAGALTPARVIRVESNVQIVRWPSAVRPDLGGHAEYALRVFRPDAGGGFSASLLENTPDLPRLLRDRAARARLIAWIRDPAHLDAIARGTAVLPDEFLARVAVSVSPRGLSRRANRPFRQLVEPAALAGVPLAGRTVVGSPEALVRRLDDMSCAGCHQSRTIAGFHLLGEDGPDAAAGNALAVAMSAPLVAERRRRADLALALAAGATPDFTRPFAERAADPAGRSGARCDLAGDPGFADWTCADGFTCARLDAPADDAALGVCVPAAGPAVGDPCETGLLTAAGDSHRDRVGKVTHAACAVGVCNGNRVGFPAGMCTATCDDLPEGATCGAIALLTPFNNCLARNTPFPRCLAEHVSPAGLRACSEAAPCRDDYICARTASGNGACIPPYFLFQLRVDGHP